MNVVVRTVWADDVAVDATVPVTIVNNDADPTDELPSDGGLVTWAGGNWTSEGFEAGQWIMIRGIEGIGWRLLEIIGGQTLKLGRGSPLPNVGTPTSMNVFAPGPHGGLTVVHGGGNLPLSINIDMRVNTNSVTRLDGLAWTDDGYAQYFASGLPQHIQVGSSPQTRTSSGFDNSPCPYTDPFPGCGVGSSMKFTAGEPALSPVGPPAVKTLVYVAEPKRSQVSGTMNISVTGATLPALPTSTLTCGTCDFAAAGFKVGMQVSITGTKVVGSGDSAVITNVGIPGIFTIAAFSPTTMTLANVALTPTLTGLNGPVGAPVPLTVTGYNPLLHETDPTVYGTGEAGVRLGGDTITVGLSLSGTFDAGAGTLTRLDG